MPTIPIPVEHVTLISSRKFADVLATIHAAIGHPDMHAFWSDIAAAPSFSEVQQVITRALGPSGFMQFAHLDHGQFLKLARVPNAPNIHRIILGNPLIMMKMAEHVPDAGSYAPVTVLIHERPDGVHLSYDRMASYLAPYKNPAALQVARELDAKVEALLQTAAGSM